MIEKHKTGWRVTVYAGKLADKLPTPFTGKTRISKVVTTSKRDAEKLEREFKQMLDSARTGEVNGATANDFKDDFLDACRAGGTRLTYDFALREFLRQHGDTPLADWTERDARRCAANLPRGNIIVVKTFFTRAVEKGHIDRNPFIEVAPSSGRSVKTKQDFHSIWSQNPQEQREQFTHIIQTAAEDFGPAAAGLVAWAGWTGTRPGESFVLRRENLSHDHAKIVANFDKSTGEESHGTKNHLTREIVVPPIPELTNALAAMPAYIHQPYVFTNNGRPWTPPTWYDRWKQIRKSSGNPKMRFYDLRHFCATQLLEAGVSAEDVAVQLGHTDAGDMVRKVYGHPSEDAARDRIRHTLASLAEPTRLTTDLTDRQETA